MDDLFDGIGDLFDGIGGSSGRSRNGNNNSGCGWVILLAAIIGISLVGYAIYNAEDPPPKPTLADKQSLNVSKVEQWDYAIDNPDQVKSVRKIAGVWHIKYNAGSSKIKESITTRSTEFTDMKAQELKDAIRAYEESKPSMMDKAKTLFKNDKETTETQSGD